MRLLILSNFIAALTLFCIIQSTKQDSSQLCTKKFCEEATTQSPCKELSKECNITGKGVMLLEPAFCNCCEYCLVYLEEGDDCVVDGLSQPFHDKICGPGLGCDTGTSKCAPMTTACMIDQRDFDESQKKGTWGFTQMRPLCNERGEYYPAHCIGSSICYCVNPEGERIFGEAVYTGPGVQQSMNCECSIANWKADKLASEMGLYNIPVHCLEDGSYDLLQCNDDMCRCLNSDTKTPDNDANIVLEINLMETKPECFDPDIHETGKYKRACEEKLIEILQEIELLKEDGITPVGVNLPNCQYDGRYGRLMVTDKEKQCVDPDGNILEHYVVPHNDSLLSSGMDCNCARTRWILQQDEQTELPICCDNGNFREMQCRRGKCYCVDCNGDQINTEVNENEKYNLKCSDNPTSCSTCLPSSTSTTKKSGFLYSQWDPSNDSNFGN